MKSSLIALIIGCMAAIAALAAWFRRVSKPVQSAGRTWRGVAPAPAAGSPAAAGGAPRRQAGDANRRPLRLRDVAVGRGWAEICYPLMPRPAATFVDSRPTWAHFAAPGASPPRRPYHWQEHMADTVATAFGRDKRANVMVCGPRGCGKASGVDVLARELHSRGSVAAPVEPVVVRGVSLFTPESAFWQTFPRPSVRHPVVLVIEDLPAAVDYAELDPADRTRDCVCVAQSRMVLLVTLKQLLALPGMIVLVATPCTFQSLDRPETRRYYGLFAQCYDIRGAGMDPGAPLRTKKGGRRS